jgi:hypothetical protein
MPAIKGQPRPDMIGNKHWRIAFENGTLGRPRIYDDPAELAEKINQWIEQTENSYWEKEDFIKAGPSAKDKVYLRTSTPFYIQDLCLFLGVNNKYFDDVETSLDNMKDKEKAKEFSRIISHVRNVITVQKLQGATVGAYNPLIVSKVEGLKERTDVTTNDKDISIGKIEFITGEAKRIADDLDNEV